MVVNYILTALQRNYIDCKIRKVFLESTTLFSNSRAYWKEGKEAWAKNVIIIVLIFSKNLWSRTLRNRAVYFQAMMNDHIWLNDWLFDSTNWWKSVGSWKLNILTALFCGIVIRTM